MLSDLIDRKKVRRALAWALYMLGILLVQNMIFSRITVLGVRAMFLPAAVAACGMFEGGTAGAVFGLFMGFFADMSFPENTVLFTALFALLGFFAGFAADFFLNRKFWPYMAASLVALLATALFQMLGPVIFSGAAAGPSSWRRPGSLHRPGRLPRAGPTRRAASPPAPAGAAEMRLTVPAPPGAGAGAVLR